MQPSIRFRLFALAFVALGLLATTTVWAQEGDPSPIYLPLIADGSGGEGTLPVEPTPPPDTTAWPEISLNEIATDFDQPVYVTHAGDGDVLYIVEQRGVVQRYEMATGARSVFLDVERTTQLGGESGLLSIAFPEDFGTADDDGIFYLYRTVQTDGQLKTQIQRASSTDGGQTASLLGDPLLSIDQPYPNHNGGQIQFGPDGYLYVGTGDGGSGGDPQNYAQTPASLLGKLLRLDVESVEMGYAIPDDNLFASNSDFAPEIWSYGLRNPWRFSFDRDTGDLYIGDVGQGQWEEVSFQPAASEGGENYGWRITEGAHCFNPDECSFDGLTLPVAEYDRDGGRSITGGYVYRGEAYPALQGLYFYADFVSGNVWGLRQNASAENGWESELLLQNGPRVSSFGEDAAGSLYVVDYGGTIYELVDAE